MKSTKVKKKPKSKRVIIFRGGRGIGDLLFTTPVPRLLVREGYQVDAAVRPQNKAVYQANPFISERVPYPKGYDEAVWGEWLEKLEAEYGLVINLAYTVEREFLHKTDESLGAIPSLTERREKAAGKNYYDETVRRAGFTLAPDEHFRPEMYLDGCEEEILQDFRDAADKRGEKIVLWNFNGSTRNKQPVHGFRYLKAVLERFPQSRHYLVSNVHFTSSAIPLDERVVHTGGQWNLRTAMLMTKVADLVVGPESALVNAAGCWGTPKIILYSHSAPENLGGNFLKHHPIIPECDCSPCYLIPVDFRQIWEPRRRTLAREFEKECRHPHPMDPYRAMGFHCTALLPESEIIDTAVRILEGGLNG